MKIHRDQLRQMVADDQAALRLALRECVLKEYAPVVADLPNDLLDEIIDNALRTARSFGLRAPSDLASFVYWCFEFGPEFHRHPAIRAVLADAAIAPEQKIEEVVKRVPEQAWRACEAAIHRMTWFADARTPLAD